MNPDYIFELSAEEVREVATHWALNVQPHWSEVATVLGRVEDEGLYTQYGFASARVYAEEELGLSPSEFVELAKLWQMMREANDGIPLAWWGELSKGRAAALRKVLTPTMAGAELRKWFNLAKTAKTTAALQQAIAVTLGQEPWVRWTVDVPGSLVELLETALVLALPDALAEPNPSPSRAQDRDARFRCLEQIAVQYIQTKSAI